MKKIILAGLITVGLIGGMAGTASAETLYRNGANKVTISAETPAGAVVTKARVTVKKGKKTVARNKKFYKAKKGTYKVTSTVRHFPAVTVTPNSYDIAPTCRVTDRAITSDRTSQTNYGSAEFGYDGYRTGQVTVQYTGTCTSTDTWVTDPSAPYGFTVQNLTWNASWSADESIWIDGYYARSPIASDVDLKIGDVTYVGSYDLSALPTAQSHSAAVTTKTTRTVVVR